jgi:hypothetical protein
MLEAIQWFVSYIRRSREEPSSIRSIIEAEGGEILAFRQLGALKRTPFRDLRRYPILYEFRVRYGQRYGCWFIRTSRDSPRFDWVWSDEYGHATLPVERADAWVDNNAVAIGYLSSSITVFGLIAIGVVSSLAFYLVFF